MIIYVLSFTFGLDLAICVWQAIEKHLLYATKKNEIFLNDQLMTLKKGTLQINKYIKAFNSILDKSSSIGKLINDLNKFFHMSRGLGHKYQSFWLAML